MKTTRRNFIKSLGAVAAVACVPKVPDVPTPLTEEEEFDLWCEKILALAGNRTVIINAKIIDGSIILDNDHGNLLANSYLEGSFQWD
jgi:hypothetical protein